MQTPLSLLPDARTLASRLASALVGRYPARFSILERKRPRYMSTFPNEIVTCRLADGTRHRFFCKYEAGRSHHSHGHRGGLAYEAAVYRHVLHSLPKPRPRFIGADTRRWNGDTWLVLEYLDRCTRLKDIRVRLKGISQPIAMVLAARWLGRFHAVQQARLPRPAMRFLKRYDAAYYGGWVQRAFEFAGPLRRQFPWLATLCRRPEALFAPLLTVPLTVIHGEFYINNILVRRRQVFPVDWESAALAAGEIDLAALTEGPWRKAVIRRCEREYQRARWPHGVPTSFERTLETARLYLYFRWLGERPDWTTHEKNRWRFQELRSVAVRLGFLGKTGPRTKRI